jgi:hypothetical protein
MHGRAGVGVEAMGAGGIEAGGMEATGGEAHGLVLASASDHTGGRMGGHTGGPMPTPMPTPIATRPSSPCHPPKSMCNPRHRLPPSPRHRPRGITVTTREGITPTCSNVQGDGDRWPPRRHKPEATGPRAYHPARLSSVPRGDSRASIWPVYPPPLGVDCVAAWGGWWVCKAG